MQSERGGKRDGNLRTGAWSRGHVRRRTGEGNESEETWKKPEEMRN